jgi:hypothetical protein
MPLRGFALFSGLVVIIAACGGSALTEGSRSDAGAGGGNVGSGGRPGSGGASPVAGSNAVGGSAAGMPSVAGASAAGASAAGASAAGAAGDFCSARMDGGNCDANQLSFWHDPKSGLCEPFFYGGCGGNSNRYPTRDACLKTCGGGGSNWGACKVDSDCTLTEASCCESCDPVDVQDLLALNASHLAEQMATSPCATVGVCAPCPSVSIFTATRKYFRAVCNAGQCSALDVRQSAYTQCTDSGDCGLRDGVDCCVGCDGSRFVAVSTHTTFCPNGAEPCAKCTPVPPPSGVGVTCTDQRCQLEAWPK